MSDGKLTQRFSHIDPLSMVKRENGEEGISVPVEYVKYGIFRGAEELEFYCSIHTINEEFCSLTEKQIAGLENNSIDIDSLPVDDFNFERVEKFDFDADDWVPHSDMAVVNSQDFCYYSDFNDFADEIMAEYLRRNEEQPEAEPEI